MQTRTDIINQALLMAGQDTILDPAGESKNAKLMAQIYDATLEEALSIHGWTFALKTTKLQQLAETPNDYRFMYKYRLPEDCVRVVRVDGTWRTTDDGFLLENETGILGRIGKTAMSNTELSVEYTIHGRELYTNSTDLQLVYVSRDVEAYEMSPQFRLYFAACLASKVYRKINGLNDGQDPLLKQMARLRMDAFHADSEQADTMPQNQPNLFVSARAY
jgi:hypothetical protein